MSKYNYEKFNVDKSDRKRLYFYEELFTMIEEYESVNDDINELIGWLGYVLGINIKLPEPTRHLKNVLEKDKKVDENTYRRNVSVSDICLYGLFSTIKLNYTFHYPKDTLDEITEKLYYLIDKTVFPYHKKDLDLEEVRYYTEVEYISKEKQKEIEETTNIKYDTTEI